MGGSWTWEEMMAPAPASVPANAPPPGQIEPSQAQAAAPVAWTWEEMQTAPQSLSAALGNTAMSNLIGSVGQGIAGPARMMQTADKGWADTMLHAVGMLAFDEGAAYRALTPPQRALLSNYRRATPERQAEMQAEWQSALAAGTPSLVETGTAISQYGRENYPVDPAQQGLLTNTVGMAASLPAALVAGGVGALVGGAPGGIAGLTAAMFGQAYESTYQGALAKGATPEQASEAATKNAAVQSVVNVVPLTRVLNNIPAPLRDKFVQTVAKIGQSGLEFAGANALGRFAENFVMRETVDPTTDLGEGVWDDAKAGALLGALIPGAAVAGRQVGRTARNHLGPATSAEVRADLARAAALAAKARTEALAAEAQLTIAPAQGTIPLPFNPDIPTMRITPEPEAPDGPTPAWQVENTAAIRDLLTKAPATGERIRALHDEGKTAGEIAAELGSGWSANDIRAARDVLGLVAHGPAVGMLGKVPEQELSPNALPEGPTQDVLPAELGRPAEDVAPAPEAVAPGPVGPGLLPPMADPGRPRKPPSLFDFLISRGGVQPDGDLMALGLDTVHHQRAGRLLNKKGAKADMAREAAVEAGYLPPDATLTDFYDALAEEHAGRPVYPPEYASEANEWAQGRAADRERIRGEELAEEARATAEQAGIKLTPDEEMHAARLLAEGVRPEEAIYEAVRATDAERVQAYNEARGMLSAREKGQADQRAQGAPSPEAGRARQELAVVMQRLMRHFGLPSSVGLKLVDRLVDAEGNAADASYIRSLITYALDTPAPDAPVKLFHEVTHALMDPQLGVLTETQRNALLRAADRWLAQAGNREALADLRYTQEQMREEAVARVAEEVLTRARREAPITTRAVEAMNRAVEAIGAGLRGQGFWSADGVFRAVMQGRVKGDGKGRADGPDGGRFSSRPPEGASVRDVLERTRGIEWSGLADPMDRHAENILRRAVGNVPVRFVAPEMLPRGAGGTYDARAGVISISTGVLDRPEALRRVVLHEATHAATVARLREDQRAVMQGQGAYGSLQRIMRDVQGTVGDKLVSEFGITMKADRPAKSMYGLSDVEEFIAEAWSNKKFQELLGAIPISKDLARGITTWRKATLWGEFVDTIRKILRLPRGSTSALEAVMRVSERIMPKGEQQSRRPPKPPPSGPDLFGGERREPEQRAAVPTYRTDPRQQAMPGMEPSAVQAQAARDQTGRGGLEPRVPQARPDEGLFGRPQAETSPLIMPRPETSRLIGNLKNFVDMIRDVPDTGRPHVDARTFTLDKGKNGIEYIAIIAGDRNQVVHAGTTNQPGFVAIDTSQLDFAPDGSLTVHHNHPSRSSLSVPDLAMSAVPSLANVVAHAGPDMHIGRPGDRLLQSVQDKRRGRDSFTGEDAFLAADAALSAPYKRAVEIVRAPLQSLIDQGKIDYREANRIFSDIVIRLLHQAGWVDYTTTAIVPARVLPEWRVIQGEAQSDGNLAGNRSARTIRLDEGLASLSGPMGRDAGSRPVQDPASGPSGNPRGTGPTGRQDRLLEGDDQFSRRATRQNNLGLTRPAWEVDDPTVLDSAIRLFQDNKVDLKRVQQRITDLYGPIAESRDAYGKEERYHGKVASRVRRLHEQRIKPILQQIAKNREGVTVDDVDRYLLARHAPERNAAMKKINPEREDNEALSGMSDADAAAAMVAFEREGKLKRLEAIAKDVDKLTADTRRVMRAEGLETADTIKAWEDAYQFYAPLQRDVEGQSAPRGSGFNVRGPESKRAMGSTREVKNILANIVAQAETAAIRAEKNKVTTALADLAKQYPADGFWKVDEVPTTRQINKDTGLVETIPDPLYQLADNIVMYKEGGKHHFIAFDKKNERAMEIARAMKNMDAEQIGLFTKIIGWPAKFMSQLLTRYNPEFWQTNFIRDLGGAQFNLFGTDMKGGRKDLIANIPKAMKGLRDQYRGEGKSEWARYAREMDAAGGTTGYMDMYETSDKRMDNLKSEVAKMQQGTADPRRMARATMEIIDDYNSIVENSVRLAAFQAARKQGLSDARAASIAKNITVNFNRKGNLSPALNAWFMFFNASLQGTASMIKAGARNPKARAVLGGMATIGFLLDMVNRELIEDYDRIEDFHKSHNALISTGGKNFIKIPYALGLNAVFNVGRLISEAISGASHKEPIEYAASMGLAMLDAFNPLGSVGSIGQLVAPSAFRPIVQLWENKSFTGAPVYKTKDRGPQGDAPEPAHRRHFQNTPELWVATSRALNALTGGDYVEKGAVDVSPDALRHIFTSMTGGPGRMVDRTVDYFTTDEPSVSRMPFAGRLVGKADERAKEAAYFKEARRINTAINEVDFLLKSGRPDAADDIIKKLGKGDLDEGFRILGAYRGAKKELDILRRREAPTRMQEPDDETTEIGRIMRDMRRQTMERALREGRP